VFRYPTYRRFPTVEDALTQLAYKVPQGDAAGRSLGVREVAGGGFVGDQPADDDTFTLLHDALIQHQVNFFRDEDISVEAQMDLGRRFGELVAQPNDPAC
jgi:Taurine catabolism dioxygenase TauD, TfdA family